MFPFLTRTLAPNIMASRMGLIGKEDRYFGGGVLDIVLFLFYKSEKSAVHD